MSHSVESILAMDANDAVSQSEWLFAQNIPTSILSSLFMETLEKFGVLSITFIRNRGSNTRNLKVCVRSDAVDALLHPQTPISVAGQIIHFSQTDYAVEVEKLRDCLDSVHVTASPARGHFVLPQKNDVWQLMDPMEKFTLHEYGKKPTFARQSMRSRARTAPYYFQNMPPYSRNHRHTKTSRKMEEKSQNAPSDLDSASPTVHFFFQ